jgi:hypothetical protein
MIAAIVCFFVVLCVCGWFFSVAVENAGAVVLLLLVFGGVIVLAQVKPDHAGAGSTEVKSAYLPPSASAPASTPKYADDFPEFKRATATYGYWPVRSCFERVKARNGNDDDLWACVRALKPISG